jgi:hypothetical protein
MPRAGTDCLSTVPEREKYCDNCKYVYDTGWGARWLKPGERAKEKRACTGALPAADATPAARAQMALY